MVIDKELAMKVWEAIYGDKEIVADCFGAYMKKDAFSETPVLCTSSKDGRVYDYSWTLVHIRPVSTFEDPAKADSLNNLEPVMRLSAIEMKSYPEFTVRGEKYRVVPCFGYDGYGIEDENGKRVDWKGREKRMFAE